MDRCSIPIIDTCIHKNENTIFFKRTELHLNFRLQKYDISLKNHTLENFKEGKD